MAGEEKYVFDPDALASIVAEEEERDRAELRQSLTTAVTRPSDDMASSLDLARQSGVPVSAVDSDKDRAARGMKVEQIESQLEGSKTVRSLMKDAAFASLAQDEVDNLLAVESSVQPEYTFFEEVGKAHEKGSAVVRSGELGTKQMHAVLFGGTPLTPDEEAELEELRGALEFRGTRGVWSGGPVVAASEQLPIIGDILWEGAKYGGPLAVLGAAGGATLFGLGSLALPTVGEEPAAIGTGARLGAKLAGGTGFKVGSAVGAYTLEGGNAFLEYTRSGMDRHDSAYAASAVGVVNAGLELVGLKLVGKTFQGFKPMLRESVRRAMLTETVSRPPCAS